MRKYRQGRKYGSIVVLNFMQFDQKMMMMMMMMAKWGIP